MDDDKGVVVVMPPARTEYVDRHVTITEKRAPTDESVKLLREMEAKAEAEVVKAVSIGDTSFECVVHQMRDVLSDQMLFRAVFKLNGKPLMAGVEVRPRDCSGPADLRNVFGKLRDEMAKVVAEEVLHDAFVALMRQRFYR